MNQRCVSIYFLKHSEIKRPFIILKNQEMWVFGHYPKIEFFYRTKLKTSFARSIGNEIKELGKLTRKFCDGGSIILYLFFY